MNLLYPLSQYYENLCMGAELRAIFLLSGTVRVTDDAQQCMCLSVRPFLFGGEEGGVSVKHEPSVEREVDR